MLWGSDVDFDLDCHSIGESCDYRSLQSEIGQCLFGADPEFNMMMVFDPDFQFAANGYHHDLGTSAPAEHAHQPHDSSHTSTGHHDAGSYTGGDFGGGGY